MKTILTGQRYHAEILAMTIDAPIHMPLYENKVREIVELGFSEYNVWEALHLITMCDFVGPIAIKILLIGLHRDSNNFKESCRDIMKVMNAYGRDKMTEEQAINILDHSGLSGTELLRAMNIANNLKIKPDDILKEGKLIRSSLPKTTAK